MRRAGHTRDALKAKFHQFQGIPLMQEQDQGDRGVVRKDRVGPLAEDLRKTSAHGQHPEEETKPWD